MDEQTMAKYMRTFPRHYAFVSPNDPPDYFRVLPGGRFETWQPSAKQWRPVASKDGRNALASAVANGDAYPVDPRTLASPDQRENLPKPVQIGS